MAFSALLLLSAEVAWGQLDTNSAVDDSSAARPCLVLPAGISWTCFVALRSDFSQPRLSERLPAPPVPGQTLLVDLNLTGKQELHSGTRFALDLDLVARRSWDFEQRNLLSGKTEKAEPVEVENPSYRLGLNEVFVATELSPEFQFALGKKRVLWGSGFASNPTDALNPGKNVLDPTLERRGAWLGLFEYLGEKNALSFFFAPGVLEDKNTLPEKILRYASEPGQDKEYRSLTGARWYQLLGSADVNFLIFRSERYREERGNAWKFGASWSQILSGISKKLEGHSEILVQRGTARLDPFLRSRLDNSSWHMSVLLGGRYDFENESALVVELYRQSDGDSRADLKARVENGLSNLRAATSIAAQGEVGRTVSQLGMQNYLFMNWQRYKLSEDLFLSWSIAHNLHDSAGFQSPGLQWTPSQSTSLTLSGSSEYALFSNAGVVVKNYGRLREIELNPVRARVGLELKAYF